MSSFGFSSPLSLLGIAAGGTVVEQSTGLHSLFAPWFGGTGLPSGIVSAEGGAVSMLAPWAGGVGVFEETVAADTSGYNGLFAFWIGGGYLYPERDYGPSPYWRRRRGGVRRNAIARLQDGIDIYPGRDDRSDDMGITASYFSGGRKKRGVSRVQAPQKAGKDKPESASKPLNKATRARLASGFLGEIRKAAAAAFSQEEMLLMMLLIDEL